MPGFSRWPFLLLAATVLAACAPTHSPGAAATTSLPSASVSASAASSSGPAPELLFGVLESHSKAAEGFPLFDTVAIAGLDGYARAKTTFSPLTPPYVGCVGPLFPPQGYTAARRVYFIDGKGVVRSLGTDRAVSRVTAFPIGSQQEASFAVSPDGRHLLGAILTLPPRPSGSSPCSGSGTGFAPGDWSEDVYSAEAGGTPHLISHRQWPQDQADNVLELVGWVSSGPIATFPASIGTQGGGPIREGWYGPVVEIDQASGRVSRTLGSPECFVRDVIEDGSYACFENTATPAIAVHNRDDSLSWRAHGNLDLYVPLLAPDRNKVAAQGAVLGRDGSQIQLGLPGADFFSTGWLDNLTVIGWFGPQPNHLGFVRTATPSRIEDLGFEGTFVGSLQSG